MIPLLRFYVSSLSMVWILLSSSLCSQLFFCIDSGRSPVVSIGHGDPHNPRGNSISPPPIPASLRQVCFGDSTRARITAPPMSTIFSCTTICRGHLTSTICTSQILVSSGLVNLWNSLYSLKLQAVNTGVGIASTKLKSDDSLVHVPGPRNRKICLMFYQSFFTTKASIGAPFKQGLIITCSLISDSLIGESTAMGLLNLEIDEHFWFIWQKHRLCLTSEYRITLTVPLPEILLFSTTTNPLKLLFTTVIFIYSELELSLIGNSAYSHNMLGHQRSLLGHMNQYMWHDFGIGLGSQLVSWTHWNSTIWLINILAGILVVYYIGWMDFGLEKELSGMERHSVQVINTHQFKLSYLLTVKANLLFHKLLWKLTATFRSCVTMNGNSHIPKLLICLGMGLLNPLSDLYSWFVQEIWNLDRWHFIPASFLTWLIHPIDWFRVVCDPGITFTSLLSSHSLIRESLRSSLLRQSILSPSSVHHRSTVLLPIRELSTACKRAIRLLRAANHWSIFGKCTITCIKHLDPIETISMFFENLSCFLHFTFVVM